MVPFSLPSRVFASLFAASLLAACAHPPPAATSRSGDVPAKDRMVLVLSIDGLPAYALADPKLPIANLRRLAREGATASGMRVANPSITWPNHTTLSTGVLPNRHGVLFNGGLLRDGPRAPLRVEHRDRQELVRVPTLSDLAHGAGLTTGHADWVPPQVGGTVTWAFPERPTVTGPLERELIGAGVITVRDVEEFRRAPITWRDEVWTRATKYVIWRHRPNLFLFHLLNLDSTHHQYGPRTLAGASAISLADARIGELLNAVAQAELTDRVTVFVVSDHGFKEVRREIRPHAALRRAGLLEADGARVIASDVSVISYGGTALVHVDRGRRGDLVPRLKQTFGVLEGVARVLEPAEYSGVGLPTPEENEGMGDLVLVAKSGYAFTGSAEGNPVVELPANAWTGAHGYLSDDEEMDAVFIAWGYGIRSGSRLGRIRNVDVAPTVAATLGLEMKGVEGRVLREILTVSPP